MCSRGNANVHEPHDTGLLADDEAAPARHLIRLYVRLPISRENYHHHHHHHHHNMSRMRQQYEEWFSWREEMKSIESLHDKAMFLSGDHFHSCMDTSIKTAISITLLHLIILGIARRCSSSSSTITSNDVSKKMSPKKELIMTLSYQATNLLVNLFLAMYGYLYFTTNPFPSLFFFFSSPSSSSSTKAYTLPLLTRMISHPENAFFGSLQVGYSLWSLPMGLFIVHESPVMIIHHISTLMTSLLSSLFLPGFRIYAPFFFGLIELSSVPLAMINYLKDHYEWTMVHVPTTYQGIRFLFAFLFLSLRVVLWIPQILPVLKALALLAWICITKDDYPIRFVIIVVFWLTILVLTALQLYWGMFVAKSLVIVLRKKQKTQ